MLSDYDSGEVKIMEPEKCEKLEWFDWQDLPEPLFLPVQNVIKSKFDPLVD